MHICSPDIVSKSIPRAFTDCENEWLLWHETSSSKKIEWSKLDTYNAHIFMAHSFIFLLSNNLFHWQGPTKISRRIFIRIPLNFTIRPFFKIKSNWSVISSLATERLTVSLPFPISNETAKMEFYYFLITVDFVIYSKNRAILSILTNVLLLTF